MIILSPCVPPLLMLRYLTGKRNMWTLSEVTIREKALWNPNLGCDSENTTSITTFARA